MITFLTALGVFIFIAIHGVSLNFQLRNKLISNLGLSQFKILYSIIAALGLGLMLIARFFPGEIFGEIQPFFYKNIHMVLPLVSILISCAYLPRGHIKNFFKHPMLFGILIWSLFHLMINNNLNHFIFFGGFFIFCIFMLVGIAFRDKEIEKEKRRPNIKWDIFGVLIGSAMHGLIVYSHGFLAGVSL